MDNADQQIIRAQGIIDTLTAQNKMLAEALRKIADFKHDCGCLPCRGQCVSEEALKAIIDDMRDRASEAITLAQQITGERG